MTPGTSAGAPPRPLTVRRTFDCSREQVFEAWTDPEALRQWFGGALGTPLAAVVDLRVGGAYRLTMEGALGTAVLEGVYREIDPPARLVYTWRWDRVEIDSGRESLVTVEFHERDGTTEVVVTHEGVEQSLVFHSAGWEASLDKLEEVLSRAGG